MRLNGLLLASLWNAPPASSVTSVELPRPPMTKLLERAIAEAAARPEPEQDALAALILAEIDDERKWDQAFAATTDEQWDKLAEMARRDIAAGGSSPLGDVVERRRD